MSSESLLFTKNHEWISINGDKGKVGISDYAQKSLGDIVYVELPDLNRITEAEEVVATIESVKAVSDIYAPVSGEIIQLNEEIENHPELINSDPYGKGWIFEMSITNSNTLMNEAEYLEYLKTLDH